MYTPSDSYKGRGKHNNLYLSPCGRGRCAAPGEGYSSFLKILTFLTLGMVLGTAFIGALVAGHKAGLVYNTFPYMGEGIVPYELFKTKPWWKDLLENPVSVQFLHRLMALSTAFLCGFLWLYQRPFNLPSPLFYAYGSVALAALIQVILGIATLLGSVPLVLAVLHQAFAFLLFGGLLYTLFLLRTNILDNTSPLKSK